MHRVGLSAMGFVAVGLVIGASVSPLDVTTRTILGLAGAGLLVDVAVLALYPSGRRH